MYVRVCARSTATTSLRDPPVTRCRKKRTRTSAPIGSSPFIPPIRATLSLLTSAITHLRCTAFSCTRWTAFPARVVASVVSVVRFASAAATIAASVAPSPPSTYVVARLASMPKSTFADHAVKSTFSRVKLATAAAPSVTVTCRRALRYLYNTAPVH